MGLRNSLLTLVLVVWAPITARAETYYVDWQNGADTNDGLASSHAWKRHPYMQGFAGHYTHAAGDRFIFRGGVTWPNEAFQMKLLGGGDSDTHRDYYGVDRTWFAGDAWQRPIFDLQGRAIAVDQIVLDTNGQPNLTIEGIEIRNQYVGEGAAYLKCGITSSGSDNVTVRDVYIHDWIMDRTSDENVGGVCATGGNGNMVLEDSEIGPSGPTGPGGAGGRANGGLAARNIAYVRNNRLHGCPNTVLGGGTEISGNAIFDVTNSFDPAEHENAIETFQPSNIHDNVIHDVAEGVTLLLSAAFATPGGPTYVYDNVIYHVGPVPIGVDCRQTPTVRTGVYIYNNTIEHGEYTTINVSGTQCDELDLRNNLYVTDISWTTPACYGNSICDAPGFVIDDHNLQLTQAQATAAGLTPDDGYRPTAGDGPTVDRGTPLDAVITSHATTLRMLGVDLVGVSRPHGSGWDIGAYEYTTDLPDAGSLDDAGSVTDAGFVTDGGLAADAATKGDAGASDASAVAPKPDPGGCGCRVAPAKADETGALGLVLVVLAAVTRRRVRPSSRRAEAACRETRNRHC